MRFLTQLIIALTTLSSFTSAQLCERIISLSPSITDTLASLNLGNKIVGGTRYDLTYESFVKNDIGGMIDPNLEKILTLKPSVIFHSLEENSPFIQRFKALGLTPVFLPMNDFHQMDKTLGIIGKTCQISDKTTEFYQSYQKKIDSYFDKTLSVKILLLYGDESINIADNTPKMAAGKSYHGDLLKLIGSQNAYQGNLNAPILSKESLIYLQPDVIILLDNNTDKSAEISEISIHSTSQILTKKIYFIKDKTLFLSSPDAIIQTLSHLHRILKK